MLKPGVTFLNHGSFGAVPRAVMAAQDEWRRRIEAEPVEIIGRRNLHLIEQAKAPVAQFLSMDASDFGLVTNATEAVNAVLQSLDLSAGDELLTTDHVYHAVRQAMRRTAGLSGATVREVAIPPPVNSPHEIETRLVEALSPRTRLVVVDHVTSPTGLVFPVEAIGAACRQRNIELLVDGAHAPGMVPLDIPAIGATYYAANLHKWCCAPKGSAFLWVCPDRRDRVHPTVVSHYFGEGFAREFAWQGTRDLSAWLTIPAALSFMADLGWERVMRHNHELAVAAHQMLVRRLGVQSVSPLDGHLIGATATVRLPAPLALLGKPELEALQQRLYRAFNIEVPLMQFNGENFLRVSCQVYNTPGDYARLADVIEQFVRAG